MHISSRSFLAACMMGLALPAQSLAQTTISTESAGTITHSFGGTPVTWGQTFRAPNATDLMLDVFRLSLGASISNTPYTARLAVWDAAASRMGSVLFEQTGIAPTTRQYFDFNVGQLLAFGVDYIFAISLPPGAGQALNHLIINSTAYADGNEVFIASSDMAALTSQRWFVRSTIDVGFTAQFSPAGEVVPEPMTMVLLGSGLLGLGVVRRRRKSANDAD